MNKPLSLRSIVFKLFFIFLPLMISACSNWEWLGRDVDIVFSKPRVHLYLYSNYKADAKKYISALGNSGYEVVLRKGELPISQDTSFIIHSPGVNPDHSFEIENIVKILEAVGVRKISQYQYRLGKHSYTPNNVGIYLL